MISVHIWDINIGHSWQSSNLGGLLHVIDQLDFTCKGLSLNHGTLIIDNVALANQGDNRCDSIHMSVSPSVRNTFPEWPFYTLALSLI